MPVMTMIASASKLTSRPTIARKLTRPSGGRRPRRALVRRRRRRCPWCAGRCAATRRGGASPTAIRRRATARSASRGRAAASDAAGGLHWANVNARLATNWTAHASAPPSTPNHSSALERQARHSDGDSWVNTTNTASPATTYQYSASAADPDQPVVGQAAAATTLPQDAQSSSSPSSTCGVVRGQQREVDRAVGAALRGELVAGRGGTGGPGRPGRHVWMTIATAIQRTRARAPPARAGGAAAQPDRHAVATRTAGGDQRQRRPPGGLIAGRRPASGAEVEVEVAADQRPEQRHLGAQEQRPSPTSRWAARRGRGRPSPRRGLARAPGVATSPALASVMPAPPVDAMPTASAPPSARNPSGDPVVAQQQHREHAGQRERRHRRPGRVRAASSGSRRSSASWTVVAGVSCPSSSRPSPRSSRRLSRSRSSSSHIGYGLVTVGMTA